MAKVLIACIGNIFLGDDGFGVEVARRLVAGNVEGRGLPEGVHVVDFGIRGFDLAFALTELTDPWDHVVLVDAMTHGAAPGEISVIEPDLSLPEEAAGSAAVEPHGMHPLNVLRMVQQMGATPPPLTLLVCQPQECGGEDGYLGLSPAVEAAVPVALETLGRLLNRLLGRLLDRLPPQSLPAQSRHAEPFRMEENRS